MSSSLLPRLVRDRRHQAVRRSWLLPHHSKSGFEVQPLYFIVWVTFRWKFLFVYIFKPLYFMAIQYLRAFNARFSPLERNEDLPYHLSEKPP